jgi:A/G-specific adenine glycosylase
MIFSEVISNWYQKNGRKLPWRDTDDPYKIWLSEVILQQTRVDQGMPYYKKFIEKYPDIQSLASATEQQVLKDWQGLGYYSRARNLHAAAKQVVNDFSGKFPDNHDDIRSLKGVGDYTAAAISSFAFGLPYPVVDGNVIRLLSRYFGIDAPVDTSSGARIIKEAAAQIFDTESPARHNQAIMEFGALQCVPASPDCMSCPLVHSCVSYERRLVDVIPVKARRQKTSKRYFNYILIRMDDKVVLQKRSGNDIWRNLFELPLIETPAQADVAELIGSVGWSALFKDNDVVVGKVVGPVTHKLSHREIIAQFIQVEMKSGSIDVLPEADTIPVRSLGDYPVPRLLENYFSESVPEYSGK